MAFGPLQALEQPIVSLRWRHISFMHTTWDRFQEAQEIIDLLLDGGEYVARLYVTPKERGLPVRRDYEVKEPAGPYRVPLAVLAGDRRIELFQGDAPATAAGRERLADKIVQGLP